MRRILIASLSAAALIAPVFLGVAPASAAPDKDLKLKCVSSDPEDVVVVSETNTVTITDDPSTGGNNFGCYTNLAVMTGDIVTFDYTGVDCGGGVPRVFFNFNGGKSENTFDSNPTCSGPVPGTITYTLVNSGRIKSFAFINDRGDGSTVTYSNLVINGTRIDF